MRLGSKGVGAVLAATTLAAGCTATTKPGPEQTPEEGASAQMASALDWADSAPAEPSGAIATTSPRAPEAIVLDLATAREADEGADYEIVSSSTPTAPDWTLMTLALRPDGRTVAAQVPAGQYDGGAWLLKPSAVGVADGTTFDAWRSSQDAVAGDHPRQTYQASTDGTSTAWVETASAELGVSNWRIFVDDRGAPRLLAASEEVFDGALPVRGEGTKTVLAGGRVYWNTAVPLDASASSFGAQVMSRTYDGSEPSRVEVIGAGQPAIASDGLYAVRSRYEDPAVADGVAEIVHVLVDGTDEAVVSYDGAPGSIVTSLVADGSVLAFSVVGGETGSTEVVVFDTDSDQIVQVPLAANGSPATLAVCGEHVVWTTANGSTDVPDSASIGILDTGTMSLSRIVDEDNYAGVWCAGDYLLWRTLKLTPSGHTSAVVARWSS